MLAHPNKTAATVRIIDASWVFLPDLGELPRCLLLCLHSHLAGKERGTITIPILQVEKLRPSEAGAGARRRVGGEGWRLLLGVEVVLGSPTLAQQYGGGSSDRTGMGQRVALQAVSRQWP
jgi:hypothetical protein